MNNKKIILLFSHNLNNKQIEELKNKYNIKEIVKLPEKYQEIWSNANIFVDYKKNYKEILDYVLLNMNIGDYALVQGEWGYTYNMVNSLFENGIIPIYAFSTRNVKEVKGEDDKILKISEFKHIQFVEYRKW
ncbi:CRISPR-associated protein Csx20 [Oceanivirga salmonicida]|uniref:CRISPR-associated protein Csx20 n=1 Tax=Oceanivirga salmonicida TaxID=1769291 RepID=UPI0012E1ABDB|nr:CRISPR-associated protein Csx20 [Oceanivirga salmonicida]